MHLYVYTMNVYVSSLCLHRILEKKKRKKKNRIIIMMRIGNKCCEFKKFLKFSERYVISFLRLDRIRNTFTAWIEEKVFNADHSNPQYFCPNLFQLFYSRIHIYKTKKLRKKYYPFTRTLRQTRTQLPSVSNFPSDIRYATSDRRFLSKPMIDHHPEKKKKKPPSSSPE